MSVMSPDTVRIVIPTYNEAGNIGLMLKEIAALTMPSYRLVIDFIDDSPNRDTVEAIERESSLQPSLTVKHLHRKGSDRTNGLAGAVTAGIRRAQGDNNDIVIVMDGDGQHPPAVIPSMLARLQKNFDLVVASRYVKDGSHEGLNGTYRVFISRTATLIARSLFPRRLRKVTDPMTGLFAVQLNTININEIEATGFKILFELLVASSRRLRVSEVPVIFRTRNAGDSKADAARGIEYLQQLVRLRFSSLPFPISRKEEAPQPV